MQPFIVLVAVISYVHLLKYRLINFFIILIVLAVLSELFTLVGDSAVLNKFNLTITIPYDDQLPFSWFQKVKGSPVI